MSLSFNAHSHNPVKDHALRCIERSWVCGPAYHPVEGGCSCKKGRHCTHVGKHSHGKWPVAVPSAGDVDSWDPLDNLAIYPGRSGFSVIEIDPHKGGSLDALEKYVGRLPETATAISGRGGHHFYFQGLVRTTADEIMQGVDSRGVGGLIIGPGSLHYNGNRYAWLKTPEDVGMAVLPEALQELLAVQQFPNSGSGLQPGTAIDRTALLDDGTALPPLAQYWLDYYLRQAEGHRNHTGLLLALQLRDHDIDPETAGLVMVRYADQVGRLYPADHAYLRSEATASLRQAYSRQARPPCLGPWHSNECQTLGQSSPPTPLPYAESGRKIPDEDKDLWDQVEAAALAADTMTDSTVTPQGRGRPKSARRHDQYAAVHDAMALAGWPTPARGTLDKWWHWLDKAGHAHDASGVVVATIRQCAAHRATDGGAPIGYVQRVLCQRLGIPYTTRAQALDSHRKQRDRDAVAMPVPASEGQETVPHDEDGPLYPLPSESPLSASQRPAMVLSAEDLVQRLKDRQEEAAWLAALRQAS